MPLSDRDLDLIFRCARTANFYHPREVTPEEVRSIWELMKWGPTSANCMPARIVWCLSEDAKSRLAECASSANADKIMKAPAAAILGMDMEFYEKLPHLYPATDARSWFVGNEQVIRDTALRKSSLQGAYLIIAARSLGFGVGPMSGFDNAAVDRAFFSGASVRSNFIMTLGHPDTATHRPRGPRLDFSEANKVP
ncbi:MAG TPA: malonic semialdehyde reductase [Allosphingosinicella sp.]|nr:malonic semialdehyde reductase [Allosphingosinicella sp.]